MNSFEINGHDTRNSYAVPISICDLIEMIVIRQIKPSLEVFFFVSSCWLTPS